MEKIEQIVWDILAEEGITEKDLELVDLDINFSPVIPIRNGEPFEVIEAVGGGYLIPGHPIYNRAVSSQTLKVMRYRYLINRKNPLL